MVTDSNEYLALGPVTSLLQFSYPTHCIHKCGKVILLILKKQTFMKSSFSKQSEAGPLGNGTLLTGSPVIFAILFKNQLLREKSATSIIMVREALQSYCRNACEFLIKAGIYSASVVTDGRSKFLWLHVEGESCSTSSEVKRFFV